MLEYLQGLSQSAGLKLGKKAFQLVTYTHLLLGFIVETTHL